MNLLQPALWALSLGLQLLLIWAFVQGAARRFPALFAYVLTLFATTILDIYLMYALGPAHPVRRDCFWLGELIRQTGLYVVVISLIRQALPGHADSGRVPRLLVVGAVLFWAGSIYFCRDHRFSMWMTKVVRNLGLCAAVLNFVLWGTLIASPRRSRSLLLIAAGLGVQMTGEALGQSLRGLTRGVVQLGNAITLFSHFACLTIWWYALRERSGAGSVLESGRRAANEVH